MKNSRNKRPCVSNIAHFRGVAAVIKSPTVSTYFLGLSGRADVALDRACLRAAGVLDSALPFGPHPKVFDGLGVHFWAERINKVLLMYHSVM